MPNIETINELSPLHAYHGKESIYASLILIGIAVFTVFDLIEDRYDGAPWGHIIGEAGVVIASSALALRFYFSYRKAEARRRQIASIRLERARAMAKKWQGEAKTLMAGLSNTITQQFSDWHLTEAETEIAMLLLKGFSHKEIAVIRGSNEQTVRQQATSLYNKSKLNGRAELSAFFLEDLLQPVKLATTNQLATPQK